MSQVAIEKVEGNRAETSSALDEMKALSEQIRQRAFENFERRGYSDGLAMDDWLNAERELFRIPQSELVEREGKFEARVSAPGFDPDDVQVIALPDALIVKGLATHHHDESEGGVQFCEFDQKAMFRRLDLPESIDIDKVTAELEKGILQVTAFKSNQENAERQSFAA
jgi:HSP20 family molecular chaperone IbpA